MASVYNMFLNAIVKVEWYLQRALEIYTSELGPDDPTVSRTMSLLVCNVIDHMKYLLILNLILLLEWLC